VSKATPEGVHQAWERAFRDGDLEAMMALYEDDAAFVPERGAGVVSGKDAIRGQLESFLSLGGDFRFRRTTAIEGRDVAVVYSDWTLERASDSYGNPVDLAFTTSDVVRRSGDGEWLLAIVNPRGGCKTD
jgi:uncharacterized protein (TIGR02246 family)